MKIFLRIIGVITLLVALLFTSVAIVLSYKDAEEAAKLQPEREAAVKQIETMKEIEKGLSGVTKAEATAKIEDMQKAVDEVPSPGLLNGLMCMFVVLGLLTLVAAVCMFIPRLKMATILLAGVALISIIAYTISPSLHDGIYSSKMNNPTAALVAGVPSIFVALFNFIIAKISAKRAALA
ncbi:hypothetical protein ACLI1A_04320 [Flavobacterium sp. RHBU_3]|uniref:hypothetical protein n=1 Tax=Flavobacterium sp. RHBU_3 TaxID=3391184 RepID=UPI0039854BC2